MLSNEKLDFAVNICYYSLSDKRQAEIVPTLPKRILLGRITVPTLQVSTSPFVAIREALKGGLFLGKVGEKSAMNKKKCTDCSKHKPYSEFYKNSANLDGYFGQCKECYRKKRRARYARDRARVREQARGYYADNRTEILKRVKEYTLNNPEKRKARKAVENAVKAGKLPPVFKRNCSKCGAGAEEYHHASYAKKDRLNVTPLCRKCHRRIHGGLLTQ